MMSERVSSAVLASIPYTAATGQIANGLPPCFKRYCRVLFLNRQGRQERQAENLYFQYFLASLAVIFLIFAFALVPPLCLQVIGPFVEVRYNKRLRPA